MYELPKSKEDEVIPSDDDTDFLKSPNGIKANVKMPTSRNETTVDSYNK